MEKIRANMNDIWIFEHKRSQGMNEEYDILPKIN